jgi:mannose-6-phosphate isomerase-like protein (cupin superfamily)
MQFQYPHIIENGAGERLIFTRLVKGPAGDRLEGECFVQPNCGPMMHVHLQQEEGMTILSGMMGVQLQGEAPVFYGVGESAIFKAGVPHRFWNAGSEPLHCTAYVYPVQNFEYYLSAIFNSMQENGGKRPAAFDIAWLLKRYRSEFDMLAIPLLVKKLVFPLVLFIGRLKGRHRKFQHAPEPLF